jgi:hypothetical protein
MNRQEWVADWKTTISQYRHISALLKTLEVEISAVETSLKAIGTVSHPDRSALTEKLRTLEEGLGVARSEQAAVLGSLESFWEIWWRQEMTLLLRSSQNKSPVLVTLSEFRSQSVNRDWHPWLIAPQRQARRLMRLVDLVQMMEERSFPDYRVGLDQALEGLQSEAEATRDGAEEVVRSIDATIDLFRGDPYFDANMDVLKSCINAALGQSKALATTAGQPTLKSDLADAFRNLWGVVSEQFGTWQRRIRPSIFLSLWLLGTFFILYMALCAWIPTQLLVILFLAITASAAISRYYVTRGHLEFQMKIARDGLRSLDPNLSEDARSIWRASSHEALRAFPENLYADLRRLSDTIWSLPTGIRGRYALLGIIGLLAIGVLSYANSTSFDVVVRQSSVTCMLSRGRILWAGPGQVVMYSEQDRLTVIPSESVAVIGHAQSSLERCGSTSKATLQVTSFISTDNHEEMIEKSYVLPVFSRRVHCPSKDGKYNWRPDSVFGEPFGDLMSGFRSCAVPGKAVKVRVLGYSSSKEFVGCADSNGSPNKLLASERRRYVIEMLRHGYHDSKGVMHTGLTPEQLEIEAEEEPVATENDVNDKADGALVRAREFLSRHAEIQILSSGDCWLGGR